MAERGFNPIDFLIDLAQAPKTAPDIKAKIGIELSSLINPKAKEPEEKEPPIDPEGDENDPNLPSDEKSLLSIVPNG